MKTTAKALLFAAVTLIFTACSSKKASLTYFEDLKASDGVVDVQPYTPVIQPDDELFISVSSTIPAATAAYNLNVSNPASGNEMGKTTSPQHITYLVNSAGDITMPVLGKIHVAGLTTAQLTDELTRMISKDVTDPVVTVRLRNFSVNVMGEVNSPGIKGVDGERCSILDAIAAAGDLTPYGNRNDVLLIRENNDKREYHRLNLNDASLLSSPYFYLQQNDVVLVTPNDIRQDNAKYNQFNSYKLSVISTIVSSCSIIASIIIALTVK